MLGFGGEREKWASMSMKLEQRFIQLTGDILLATGTVAYLGYFPHNEREKEITKWQTKAQELKVPFSKDYSLQGALGNQITIQSWYMNGLLRDTLSTDNGIILTTAERWVLMIDPQDIANRWIKTMEKQKNLTVLKQSDKDFLRSLENCIQFGTPVLLENVGEFLHPALEPLLQKQTFQQGGSVCIKLGESTIEYSKDFRMYITTRLKNPHFPPETTAKITMVNFDISEDGLVDQLLGIIVARERPELEEERSQVISQINENKKNLEDIENKILSVLFSSKGNILEDEIAIKTLSSSKVLANEIVEKQTNAEAAKTRIDESRSEYADLTKYAVTLYFTGNYLSSIDHMYQFSLCWFINLFCTSIDASDKSEELEERLMNIKEHFIKSLFFNTSAGLFEDDKIIYSFLLACNLGKESKGLMDSEEWNFLLDFATNQEDDGTGEDEDGDGGWIEAEKKLSYLTDDVRYNMKKLTKLKRFGDLLRNDSSIKAIENVWFANNPEKETLPVTDSNGEGLSSMEKLLLFITIRPDKLIPAVREFVISQLGETFVQQENLDVGKAYAETSAATPLIFILGEEVDPCKYIFRFGEFMGFTGKKLKVLSLGSEQEEKARDVIRECSSTATWVVLLNCHLVPHWMDELEYLCEDLSQDSTNQDFRLWLTSRPTERFSVPTLQLGVKVAIEEPTIVKTSLTRHLFPEKGYITKFNNMNPSYKKVLFAISLFHAAINERTTYAHCGWNQDYIFGEADYDLCMLHVKATMDKTDDESKSGPVVSSLGTLRYLVYSCTYGGRMEDEFDIRTLETFLNRISMDEVLEKYVNFDPEGIYHTKGLEDHETLMDYLNSAIPPETTHDLMRVSQSNHWNKNTVKALDLVRKLRSTQGLDIKEVDEFDEGGEKDEIRKKILDIMKQVPEEFELEEDIEEIMKLVLDQELQKYNNLIDIMNDSLQAALNVIDGKSLINDKIESFIESLDAGDIPDVWADAAYPTMDDLNGFLTDLKQRTDFLRDWQVTVDIIN